MTQPSPFDYLDEPRPLSSYAPGPEWHTGPSRVYHGDCLAVMRAMPESSVDSIVTDPPYGLGFMGKEWDALPPGVDFAREALRVLKPGGHMIAFGGTRTWHRLAVAIEDAGFEIRDSLAWLYGSGFPKSLDVSKAIDKLDASAERRARSLRFTDWMRSTGVTAAALNRATGTNMGGHYLTAAEQPHVPTAAMLELMRPLLPEVPEWVLELVHDREVESANYAAREVTGQHDKPAAAQLWKERYAGDTANGPTERRDVAHTPEAARWQGWGTALKPAFEPAVLARKPFRGSVAANVVEHGTGALNVAATAIGDEVITSSGATGMDARRAAYGTRPSDYGGGAGVPSQHVGRWPTNVYLDEDQAAALDAQSGITASGGTPKRRSGGRGVTQGATGGGVSGGYNLASHETDEAIAATAGGASRFFYVAKASRRERAVLDGVQHATVKPLALMRQLVRLVTPPGGVVLDPFAGSGSTAAACQLEGFDSISVELTDEHIPLILHRLGAL